LQLETDRLVLREFSESDYPALRAIEILPETHHYEQVAIPAEEMTRAYLLNAITRAGEQPRVEFRLVLTIRPADVVRGRIKFQCLRPEAGEWEIGWAVHPHDWGKGYATEAARAMLGFAFSQPGVHRVVAFCNAFNTASYRVMEKLGMRRDGLLRESLRWNGQWVDELVYAILERDWKGQNLSRDGA
jgi:[ribosomal protein S5]-alanine N-acetyltransferase